MIQQKFINGLKIILISLLLISIGFISIIEWKGDAIVKKVIGLVEKNLADSLHYETLHLEWFRYFPSLALRVEGLTLGPDKDPLVAGGHIDIVLSIWPLLKEKIIINRLLISNSHLNIIKHNARWSYEVFKKSDSSTENEWNALVHEIRLEKTMLKYDDHEGLSFLMDINDAKIEGELTGKLISAEIFAKGSMNEFVTTTYTLPTAASFEISGIYKKDQEAGTQQYDNWNLRLQGLDIEGIGSTHKEKEQEYVDAIITWENGDAKTLQQLVPSKIAKDWEGFTLAGDTEGQIKINGKSSNHETPIISCTIVLENGNIEFPGQTLPIKDVRLEVSYLNRDADSKQNSKIKAILKKGTFKGQSIQSEITVIDLEHPVLSLDLYGYLPAGVLNMVTSSSGLHFQNGAFDVGHLKILNLGLTNVSIKTLIEKSETDFKMENLKFQLNKDVIEITKGEITLDPAGHLELEAEKLIWNKAKGEDVKGECEFATDKISYKINGSICQGTIESTGTISGLGQQPEMDAEWKMRGVEIKEVMASFDNFNQTFITSENIKGKTNIWAKTLIPYDESGNILSQKILASAAIDIKDGELENMKTLEDFSKYIHLQDLRDIRFNEFRNYLKIEGGKVYLPVVFIQSNAINMSINGIHSFDQHILYNLKINAGQTVTNKLRKPDAGKNYKKARKSGWINLYYVLSGTTSAVKYEHDQKEVLSGFEQSAALKENLRTYLVDHFGYDVYWLEPNEWEDIPEYE
ncbi:MAG: AsmA-like C-terminal region-containing protein [Saprospiraceae bacterium]